MHAFLGLIKDKSLDELDKIDNETRMQKLKNADRKKCWNQDAIISVAWIRKKKKFKFSTFVLDCFILWADDSL